jgi:phosphoesterase RecJ-like protein
MATTVPLVGMNELIARLRLARRVAILTHQRPDTDALGSQCAMALILRYLGATEITWVEYGDIPPAYAFLLKEFSPVRVRTWSPETEAAIESDCDTIVAVDTCTWQQMEKASALLKRCSAKVVAVDHHLSRDPIGPVIYADTSAAACCQILAALAVAAGMTLDRELALPIMAGLAGDTGWFRFDNTTPAVMELATRLIATGLDSARLYQQIMQNERPEKLALTVRALESLQWHADKRLALMCITQEDFRQTGAVSSETEYLVDIPQQVGCCMAVALLTEMVDGRVRVSMRSKYGLDVNALCRQFGGGGHARAAGCRLEVPMAEARLQVAALMTPAVQAVPVPI